MLSIKPATAPGETPAPDVFWDGFIGDLGLVTGPGQGPRGGLAGGQTLATAVLLLLFTDARCDPTELRREHYGDRRGWVGDGFDVQARAGETELGSRLWLYRRHELVDETARQVEDECIRALQPLIKQRAVASISAKAAVVKERGEITLELVLYGSNGAQVYAARFDSLWKALDGISHPLAR